MKKFSLLLLLSLIAFSAGSAATKYILNSKRLSSYSTAITCTNGGDPTGTKIGDTLIISCGR